MHSMDSTNLINQGLPSFGTLFCCCTKRKKEKKKEKSTVLFLFHLWYVQESYGEKSIIEGQRFYHCQCREHGHSRMQPQNIYCKTIKYNTETIQSLNVYFLFKYDSNKIFTKQNPIVVQLLSPFTPQK